MLIIRDKIVFNKWNIVSVSELIVICTGVILPVRY